MIYPSEDKIEKNVESKYMLTILAAKRARQLREGADPLVDTESANPITVALEEIASGKVRAIEKPIEIKEPEPDIFPSATLGVSELLSLDGAEDLADPEIQDTHDLLGAGEDQEFEEVDDAAQEAGDPAFYEPEVDHENEELEDF
ncbi:MAG: DNA-directed RNA polymerase subunit omega [Armatimonadetes bacterium]|nr:DNA-directed RNA polymerase subunit omega [Armatimonadota bacterium]